MLSTLSSCRPSIPLRSVNREMEHEDIINNPEYEWLMYSRGGGIKAG